MISDLYITIAKIDDDNFIGIAKLRKRCVSCYATDYVQALYYIVQYIKEEFFSVES